MQNKHQEKSSPRFWEDLEIFKHFLKRVTKKILYFREYLTFRGELHDFTDKVGFTYCKLYDNKYLSLLYQLKMCLL